MADGKRNGARVEDRKPTERVVLRRAHVIVVEDTLTDAEAYGDKEIIEAWVVCGVFEGTKRGAIEAHAGKGGTPDAIPGVFKAPTATAWKGGVENVRPERPLIQSRLID